MNKLLSTILLFSLIGMPASARRTMSLNKGWQFSYDSLFTHAREVHVPHDFQIEIWFCCRDCFLELHIKLYSIATGL